MQIFIFLCAVLLSVSSFANNIIMNGTRFIYPANEREITVQMTNSANRPAIAQVWLDTGDANETPDTIKTPFQITPPISRIDANGGQAIRIKLMDRANLASDRESLWWLNVLDIPPLVKNAQPADQNVLQLAIRSRFKFIYRPAGLGNRDTAINQLVLTPSHHQLTIENPSAFYLTIVKLATDSNTTLNNKTLFLAPKSVQTITLKTPIQSGQTLLLNSINDYGSATTATLTAK